MLIPFHDDNPIRRTPYVTVGIILLNVVSLFLVGQLTDRQRRELVARYGFLPARLSQLSDRQALKYDLYPELAQVQARGKFAPRVQVRDRYLILKPVNSEIVFSWFSSLFLHAGIAHLVGNMWFFWIFGNNIEDRLGHVLFLLFYLLGGIFASLCHWLMISADATAVPVIGASGAVAVTLGAYAVLYPLARVKTLVFIIIFFTVVELPAIAVLGLWFVAQLVQGFGDLHLNLSGGVAWWAHVGGFVFGAALMPFLAAGTPEPGKDWEKELHELFDFDRPRQDPY